MLIERLRRGPQVSPGEINTLALLTEPVFRLAGERTGDFVQLTSSNNLVNVLQMIEHLVLCPVDWPSSHSHQGRGRTRDSPQRSTRRAGSTADLADIVTVLGQRGIGFRSLAEPWLDTTSAHGKLIFDMFASLAEYERSRLSERTKAGLAAAKARGRLGGRPRTMTPSKTEAARQLRSQGKTLKETAQILSVSVSSLTRALSRSDVPEVASAAA